MTEALADFRKAPRKKAEELLRLPPHSLEAEQSLLGCLLMGPDECVPRCIEALGPTGEAFYDLRHRTIFESIVAVTEANRPADTIAVSQHLRDSNQLDFIGGVGYLGSLPEMAPIPAALEYRLATVQDKWRRRRIVESCTKAIQAAHETSDVNEMLDAVAAEVAAVDEQDGEADASPRRYVPAYIDALQARFELDGALPGLATGFHEYDRQEGGLHPRQMVVVGARPYEGKTAFACNMVERACLIEKRPTLFMSLEMTREKLMDRFTALVAGVDIARLSRGTFVNGETEAITVSNTKIHQAPLYILERTGGMSSAEASASIRRYARQHKVKLVVIDYLQKLTSVGKYDKNTYGIGDTCKRLRHAAIQSGVALVCLAQLNREIDKGKAKRGPRMSDLADSKGIEQEADTVILLDRDGDNRNLVIPKSRNSGGNFVYLRFDPKTLRFQNTVIQT